MTQKISEIEIVITDYDLQLVYGNRVYFHFAIKEVDGRHRLIASSRREDDVEWVDQIPLGTDRLDVNVAVKETNSVGVPRYTRHPAKTEIVSAERAARHTYIAEADTVGNRTRDKIRDAILDAIIDNPRASKATMAAENAKIAAKYKEGKMVVAGVAAALTRGVYGDKNRLIAQRRRERLRAAKA